MRKIISIILAMLLVMSSCSNIENGAQQGADSATAWQEQYDLGIRYLTEGNYEEAIIAFTAAIEIDPRRAEAYVGRGDAYIIASGETMENQAAALTDYQAAISLDGEDKEVYIKIADVYMAQEDYYSARNMLIRAIELDETNEDVYLKLSDVYVALGEYDNALNILQSGLEKAGRSQGVNDRLAELRNICCNSYGGIKFEYRSAYREITELTPQEVEWIEAAYVATVNKNMEIMRLLLEECLNSTDLAGASFLTVWGEYKLLFQAYSNGNDETISVEFRPENGTGYTGSYHLYTASARWASCSCEDWQWNGSATIIDADEWEHASGETVVSMIETTGPMENSLRNGVFVTDYAYFTSTTQYQNGLTVKVDGEAQEPDNIYWGIYGGHYGPLDNPVELGLLYW